MVDDYQTERLIKKYAKENNYTLVANKPGALEYVKYNRSNNNSLIIMIWYKGSSDIIIGSQGKSERIKVDVLIN